MYFELNMYAQIRVTIEAFNINIWETKLFLPKLNRYVSIKMLNL